MLVEASSKGLGDEDRGDASDQERGRRAGFAEMSSIYLYRYPSSGVDSGQYPNTHPEGWGWRFGYHQHISEVSDWLCAPGRAQPLCPLQPD